MRVVALYRVSTEAQATDGTSLDSQQARYRELATQHGWTTVAEFKGCESATQAAKDRRVLQQVLECVRTDAPDAVYVHEQSRLTRGDELEVAVLMRELKERRVKVIIQGVVRDLDSIDERFMLGIQSLVDRTESERIKERLTRGKRRRADMGHKSSGPAPFGYRNPRPHEPGRGVLQIVPAQAAVVRSIFEMYAAGRGHIRIAESLNAKGVPAPRGGRWGKTTVVRILTCPAYVGVSAANVWVADPGKRSFRLRMDNPRAIIKKDAHEPIVDADLWASCQSRPRQPRAKVPRLLSRLAYVNGHAVHGDTLRGSGPCYRGPRGVAGCPWLPAAATDDRVWDAFALLASEPAMVEKLMAEAASPRERQLLDMEIEHAELQVGKLERRIATLIDMRADGDIDREQFRRRHNEATSALESQRAELARYRARAAVADGSYAPRVVKAVQVLLAGKTRLTQDQKRQVLNSIVRRIDITAERVARDFVRDAKGHIQPGSCGRWEVKRVTFQLALPGPCDAVPREPGGEALARPRAGQLGTTFSDSDQVSEAGTGCRSGYLDTIYSDSDQVSVTVALG